MPKIYISYRRADSENIAERLYQQLLKSFDAADLLIDRTLIKPGDDWQEALQAGLDRCDTMLVLIGPDWLTVTNNEGQPRLWVDDDWVRYEVEYALRNQSRIRLIPVLVRNAHLPAEGELPESIRSIAYLFASPVSEGSNFFSDVTNLVEAINQDTPASKAPTTQSSGNQQTGGQDNVQQNIGSVSGGTVFGRVIGNVIVIPDIRIANLDARMLLVLRFVLILLAIIGAYFASDGILRGNHLTFTALPYLPVLHQDFQWIAGPGNDHHLTILPHNRLRMQVRSTKQDETQLAKVLYVPGIKGDFDIEVSLSLDYSPPVKNFQVVVRVADAPERGVAQVMMNVPDCTMLVQFVGRTQSPGENFKNSSPVNLGGNRCAASQRIRIKREDKIIQLLYHDDSKWEALTSSETTNPDLPDEVYLIFQVSSADTNSAIVEFTNLSIVEGDRSESQTTE